MAVLRALKAHIINDPDTRGFTGMTPEEVAADLKVAFKARNRGSMTGREVRAAVVEAEWVALTDAKKSQFLALAASDDIDPFGPEAFIVKDIFGVGSATVTALAAARRETVSAEVFYGLGHVRVGDVEYVRAN